MSDHLGLWGLFFSAFVSATLFPGGSEVVLATLIHLKQHDPWGLLAIASLGNTLGGLSTFALGTLLARRLPPEGMRSVTPSARRMAALQRVQRWGAASLLLSWVPVLGDPLCFAAGWLRIHPLPAVVFMALGKTARYALVLAFIA